MTESHKDGLGSGRTGSRVISASGNSVIFVCEEDYLDLMQSFDDRIHTGRCSDYWLGFWSCSSITKWATVYFS